LHELGQVGLYGRNKPRRSCGQSQPVVALTSRGTDSPDQQQSGHEGVLVWFFNRSALAVRFCARVELGIGICSIVRIVQSKAKRHQLKFYSVPGQQESLSENEDL